MGDCQWVIPGIILSATSFITSCQDSECSGASDGKILCKYPGSTDGRTGLYYKIRRDLKLIDKTYSKTYSKTG